MLFRTDMADERRDMYKKANEIEDEVEGIECEVEEKDNIRITRVKILNEKGEEALNKKKGNYVTIDVNKITNLNEENENSIIDTISNELKDILKIHLKPEEDVLIVGLGNDDMVADALGSEVIDRIEVTRHIKKYFPQYLKPGERAISAIAPSVMGKTGIETYEIVKGVVDKTKPKVLIVIDSLASRNIERISKSIQISDTGIIPGGGVGNAREGLTYDALGIPVIALGIPTAVETAVIVNDALNVFIEKLQDEAKSNQYLNNLKENDNYEEIKEALNPKDYNLIVTPKEIDELIVSLSEILSESINISL